MKRRAGWNRAIGAGIEPATGAPRGRRLRAAIAHIGRALRCGAHAEGSRRSPRGRTAAAGGSRWRPAHGGRVEAVAEGPRDRLLRGGGSDPLAVLRPWRCGAARTPAGCTSGPRWSWRVDEGWPSAAASNGTPLSTAATPPHV